MADRETGGSSWVGFVAGFALLAVIALGVVGYTGAFDRDQDAAQLNINAPDIDLTPDIDLPSPPPAPTLPPSANEPASAP